MSSDDKSRSAPSRRGNGPQRGKGGGYEKVPEGYEKGVPFKYVVPFAIIAATLLVTVIIVAILNSGSGIETLYIGNVDWRDRDDETYPDETYLETLYVPFLADSEGFAKAKGTAILEITYEGRSEVLYSEKVPIKDDMGFTYIRADKFVVGNGNYTLTAKSGGSTDSKNLWITSVTEDLDVTLEHGNADEVLMSHSYEVTYKTIPVDRYGSSLRSAPMPFDIDATLSGPVGDDVLSKDWPHRDSYVIEGAMEHTMKGEYTLTVEWTNLLCRPDSEYRTVRIVRSIDVDAPPVADAGTNQETDLIDGAAIVTFDGSGSTDDGEIVEYIWDFGDETIEVTTTSPHVTHTYTASGEYYASLVVKDDSGKTSSSRWGGTVVIVING